jgi:hypothetical protein
MWWPGSGGGAEADDLVPSGESGVHLMSVLGCGESVTARPEVRRYPAKCGQEPLCVSGRGEFLHRPFPLPGGLVGVLAQLLRYFDRQCSTLGISRRWATP